MWGKQKRGNRKVQGTRQEPIGNTVVKPLIDDRGVSHRVGVPFSLCKEKKQKQSWNVHDK
jgi:hypothetical protein